MRILPFGDGVVLGEGASGGFRAPLEDMLASASSAFEFVGRRDVNSFEMTFPHHEGWPRATLSYLRDECLEPAMEFKPDILLIYAGLEDVISLPNAGIAIARFEKLIRAASGLSPECLVLCSQLITSRDHSTHQKIKAFNTSLGTLADKLSSSGVHVKRVKMHAKVKESGINDAGMPNEAGYIEMAKTWFASIDEAVRRSTEKPVEVPAL